MEILPSFRTPYSADRALEALAQLLYVSHREAELNSTGNMPENNLIIAASLREVPIDRELGI